MHPKIRELADTSQFSRRTVREAADYLPEDDAVLDAAIGEAVARRDIMGFLLLVCAGLSVTPERPPFEKPRSLRAPRQDPCMSRTRHTDKQKARILREFEHHDGSVASFCRQRSVSYQTLMNWRGRASANLPDPEQPPAFLEFQRESTRHRPAPVTVFCHNS